MKITAPAPALKAALARVGKIVASRNTMPILATVKISAGETITITATDLEITAEVEIDGVTMDPGSACIPLAELTRLVNLARNATVEISVSADIASISFGSASAQVFCMPAEDFPLAEFPDDLPHVDGGLIGDALRFCAVAASHDDTRFFLNGALIDGRDGSTVIVSTDGHRIHVAEMPELACDSFGIIPNKAVPLIAECAQPSGPFRLRVTDRGWAIQVDGARMKGACIDGTFPDWRRIAPGVRAHHVATVDAGELATAAEIAVVGFEDRKNTAVIVDVSGEQIAVSGEAPGRTMARAASKSIPAEVSASGIVCLNGTYLAAALSACGEGRVAIAVFDGTAGMDILPAEQRVGLRLSARVVGRRSAHVQREAA